MGCCVKCGCKIKCGVFCKDHAITERNVDIKSEVDPFVVGLISFIFGVLSGMGIMAFA